MTRSDKILILNWCWISLIVRQMYDCETRPISVVRRDVSERIGSLVLIYCREHLRRRRRNPWGIDSNGSHTSHCETQAQKVLLVARSIINYVIFRHFECV